MDNENTMAAENQPQADEQQAETQMPATDALEQPQTAEVEAVTTPDEPPMEATTDTSAPQPAEAAEAPEQLQMVEVEAVTAADEPLAEEATDALGPQPAEAAEAVTEPPAETPVATSAGEAAEATDDAGPTDIKDLKPGMRLMGKVKNMVDFGAFIDIGVGRDGLAHISTLKRAGVDKTLKVGDEVEVQVRRADLDNNRISLTIPGAGRSDKARLESLEVGSTVTGRVVRLVDFGAFVDVDAQTDGLVHISQLSDGFVSQVSDVLEVGQEVEVRILDVDVERRRISLTMKAEGEAPPQYTDRPEPPMADERPRRGSFGGDRFGGERAGRDRNSRYDDDRPPRERRDHSRGRRREPQVISTDQETAEPGSTGVFAEAWEKALRDRRGRGRS